MSRTDSSADQATAAISRRSLLGRIAAAGGAGLIATGMPFGSLFAAAPDEGGPHALDANAMHSPIGTPAEAMRALVEGNRRFADGRPTAPNRSLSHLKDVAPKQAPFAAVLSCADSRVPVEILFDQGLGDVFVCRVAGNIVTPEMLASLEFGTLVLGAKALIVLGHSACGAVKATIAGEAVPGQISTLYQHIQPAVDRAAEKSSHGKAELEAATQENVRMQLRLLARSSPVLRALVKEGKLSIGGAMYDVATGRVAMLD